MIKRLRRFIDKKIDAAITWCFKFSIAATTGLTVFFALMNP